MIPEDLTARLREILNTDRLSLTPVSGGDIHQAFLGQTDDKQYFIKYNPGEHAYAMFQSEARGLSELAPWVKTPFIHGLEPLQDQGAYLLMDYFAEGSYSNAFWQRAGHDLARLHQQTSDRHGCSHDAFIGTIFLNQFQSGNWAEAFIRGFLEPPYEVIRNKSGFDATTDELWQRVKDRIPYLVPDDESPALLHGDLWAGNLYCTSEEDPLWIDPSPRYGHREVDLAMTTLFGGFPNDFYEAYVVTFPQREGWNLREKVYQLYPLFVHVAMFGLAYLDQTVTTLKRILEESDASS